VNLKIFQYSIPLANAFKLSNYTILNREGLIFRLEDAEDVFYAEAAPLPGFSAEKLQDVIDICQNTTGWTKWFSEVEPPHYSEEIPPSLQFALSSLWMLRKARASNKTLQDYLSDGLAHKHLPVNKTIGLDEVEKLLAETAKGVDEGFETFKFKVGPDTNREANSLQAVRTAFPDIKIRLDANGCWSAQQAKEALKRFEPLNIEYCEQPIPPGDNEGMAWLSNQTYIPLAADESVRTFWEAQEVINLGLAKVLIIKPMLIGSVHAFMDILALAQESNVKIVVTTSLDSGIARRITAQLASAIRRSEYAHGLATGAMFAHDICPDDHLIKRGHYLVSEIEQSPGLHNADKLIYEASF